jgi:hypothetical protein
MLLRSLDGIPPSLSPTWPQDSSPPFLSLGVLAELLRPRPYSLVTVYIGSMITCQGNRQQHAISFLCSTTYALILIVYATCLHTLAVTDAGDSSEQNHLLPLLA